MRRSWSSILLAALIIQIPFELRHELLGLSNLQWTFVALLLVSAPSLVQNWKIILRQRAVQAAMLFIIIQWLTAVLAPDFKTNAIKAATRFTAGFILFVISSVMSREDKSVLRPAWVLGAAGAVFYALSSYAGFGFPSLFRTEEFYIGQVQRLSGSFEYPNTAAAYFAMSIPIVWWSQSRSWLRWGIAFLLWCAVVLTFSRGALVAVPAAIATALALSGFRMDDLRPAVTLVALGIAAYAVLVPLNPYWMERIYGPGARNPFAAEYKTAWNYLRQQPGASDEIPIQIHNVGIRTWRAGGWWRSGLAYRWWNTSSEAFVPGASVITPLDRDIGRGDAADVTMRFQTPSVPGKYLLVAELFNRDFDWFSRMGIVPSLVEVDVQPGAARSTAEIDLSAFYHRGQRLEVTTVAVPRPDLWKAALRMSLDHPLGVGPDNYRLQYGKYLGAARWDTHLYSNNLFLEILAGSGIVGLAAFVLMLSAVRWRFQAESLSIGIFLVHGLVDVFLMTTPIYFAFWLLLGKHAHSNPV